MGEDIDPFKILNLPEEDVPQAAIDKAFKLLALKYHPDKNPDPSAQETFQRIQLAKEMLLDPETKAALLRVKRAKRARDEQEQELEGQALEQAQARKRFATELAQREKQNTTSRSELQTAQASLTAQMRKWHEERLARKREQLRKQAPTAAAAMAAAAAATTGATEAAESGTRGQTKPVDSETIGLLHKSLEVRWSSQHVQHDADSLRKVFEKFGDVVHVSMRGKRRTSSSQRKAVVVMARSSAATAAAAHGSGAGAHILITPLPKVANLELLPGASPEVLEAAAASLRRAGIKGGGSGTMSSVGLAAAAVAASQSVGAPPHSTAPSPHLNAPDALTVVLAAAAAAAASAGGGTAGSSGAGGAVTTGTAMPPTTVPTSFPPSFPVFPRTAQQSGAGPSGTTGAAAFMSGIDEQGSNALPGANIPSSFPVRPPMPSGSTQATDTPFRAPESRVASAPEATETHTKRTNAALSSFPLNPPVEGGSLQEGSNSINAQKPQAAAAASMGAAADAPASAVQKQLDREKLRAQRLAELEAEGSSDDEGT